MVDFQVAESASSQKWLIKILDSTATNGAGKTGLAFNTAGLTCYYMNGNIPASVAVSLVTITTFGTYVSGGFKEVDATNMPGVYEFHPPNAAFNSTQSSVVFVFKGAAGMSETFVSAIQTSVNLNASTADIRANVTTMAANVLTATAIAANAITAAKIATDAIGAAQLAADAVTEIQTGLATPTNITAGVITTVTNLTNAPTSGDLTAAMKTSLNAATPAVTVSDKTGFSLAVAPPTAAAIRAEIDTNSTKLDVAVSSRMATFTYTTPPTAVVIADTTLRRTTANIEASSDGDAISGRSLYGAIARLAHKVTITGGIMTVTKADDTTTLTTAALTTDAAADPTTGIDPA